MDKITLKKNIAGVLAAHKEIQLGIVFGSAAAGTMRADSDVDVAVFASKPLSVSLRLDLIAELSLALGREVDVVDLYSAEGVILHQVLTKGEVVLKRSDLIHAMLIKRMLFDQADMEPLRCRIVESRLQRGFNG
ncbi:type VII toxin-antitoxin system MntA family adenylyltransferase antitoxin [Halodesulfovibrio aestuarii]|uniref:Nucleotidyltransferase domain-containing protein n=1 Tax=Halodesulfovibrio aestuarii TaxID=126333 RepID=A0A8G2C8W7_9BACT|nr:nucleotidyltransferase domain-containing protein [Halodesulfovibrio aestuarii]SHI99884.1 Nucleotidyltransferase domain-containing protein [Halodesulfovibrio aestuarii]